jgi:DNA-directed RNA polymerase specialized sigma24 family protein
MSDHRHFHILDAIASHLSFPLDATDEVNRAFQCWQAYHSIEAKHAVHLWTYCYVYRYFTLKFMQVSRANTADFDLAVGQAYGKIQDGLKKGGQIERYASWVSVICRNTYINYLRSRTKKQTSSVEGSKIVGPVILPSEPCYDEAVLLQVLRGAIGRLPPSLREVARLRFVENRGYEDISGRTGQALPKVRTYAHRATKKLVQDPELLEVIRFN